MFCLLSVGGCGSDFTSADRLKAHAWEGSGVTSPHPAPQGLRVRGILSASTWEWKSELWPACSRIQHIQRMNTEEPQKQCWVKQTPNYKKVRTVWCHLGNPRNTRNALGLLPTHAHAVKSIKLCVEWHTKVLFQEHPVLASAQICFSSVWDVAWGTPSLVESCTVWGFCYGSCQGLGYGSNCFSTLKFYSSLHLLWLSF